MSVIDKELAKMAPADRTVLEYVRKIISKTVPTATEVITYGMPGFKYNGKYLISFGAFKDHVSIFPGSEAIAAHAGQLKGFTTSKGTVQFTADKPLPDNLIVSIVQHRVSEIES